LMAQRGAEGWMWLAALAALPIGWLVGALLPPARRAEEGRGDRRIGIDLSYLSRVVRDVFIVPALAASVALRIEWFHHFAIWPVLLLVILSGDARWLGALLGAMTLGGRRWLRTMRLVLGSMACGPTQLAITSIAIHGWILPERFVAALLLGAITVELTAPARRGLARRLAEAEVELDRLDEEA
jgi:hypothetical protein